MVDKPNDLGLLLNGDKSVATGYEDILSLKTCDINVLIIRPDCECVAKLWHCNRTAGVNNPCQNSPRETTMIGTLLLYPVYYFCVLLIDIPRKLLRSIDQVVYVSLVPQ